jgi:hypothetical protein
MGPHSGKLFEAVTELFELQSSVELYFSFSGAQASIFPEFLIGKLLHPTHSQGAS